MKKLETNRRWISLARSGMNFFKKITEGLEVPNEIIDPINSIIFNSVFFDQMLFYRFKRLGFYVSPDKAISFKYSVRDSWRNGGAFFDISWLRMMTPQEFEDFNSKVDPMKKRYYRFLGTIANVCYVWDKEKDEVYRSINLGDNLSVSLAPSDRSGVNMDSIRGFCSGVPEIIEQGEDYFRKYDPEGTIEVFRNILRS